jgi:hypothetical protein
MNLEKCKEIAEMRKTDYFCDEEAHDAICWLISELENYTEALWKASGDDETCVNAYLEATK